MSTRSAPVSILWVDHDSSAADRAVEGLEAGDDRLDVTAVVGADSALARLDDERFDGVVTAATLPESDGLALLRRIREAHPVPVLVVDADDPAAALDAGAADCLSRPTEGWDVTARRVVNAVGAADSRRRRDVVETAQEGLAILNDDGEFVHVNGAYADLYGYDPAEMLGEHWSLIYPDDETAFVREEVFPTVEREGYWHGYTTGLRADGSTFTEDHVLSTTEGGELVCSVRDVTAREKRERERERYRHMVSTMQEAACIYDADGRFELVNDFLADFYGTTPAGLVGESSTLVERIRAEAAGDPYRELVEGEREELRGEYEGEFPGHGHAIIDYRMVRLTIDGEFDGVAAVARDVTDRKRREHELERYETIVEASGDVVYTLDAEGCLTFVNDTVRDLTGYEPADLVGEHISAMMDPADVERGQRHVRSLLSGDRQHTIFEMEVITADGEHVPCENHVALLPYETTFRGTVGVLRDITRRKEIEEELRQYQRAVEGANDLIAAVDPDYRFLFANRRYREFHGADAAITGVHLGTVLDDDAYETARPYIERAMDGEEVGHRARRSRPAQGDRIFDIRYAPLRDADGGIAGVVNTMRDITDRTDRERQLDVLDRVLRHNLHNEMNVMVGYAETIREEVSGDHREWADRIVRSGEKLLELADKEREIVELITEPRAVREFDVAALVRGAVDPYLDAHPDATVDFDVPADASIRTLPEMETAVMELVENALDHAGSEPMVHITVTAADERVVIRIADDGPGIPPLERDILTGDVEIDTLHHGSGMGLWLVNWIVTLGGGRLDFEENDPRGSVVTLSLPRELSEERMSTTTTPVR